MEDILDNIIKPKTAEATKYRVGAAVFDYLFFLTFLIFFVLFFGERVSENTYQVRGPLALIPFGFWFIYFVLIESILKGSIGNRIMGLKVQSLNDEPLRFSQVLKRRICDILDICWCFGLLGFILMKNTVNNQRLGDIWAKTIVVRA